MRTTAAGCLPLALGAIEEAVRSAEEPEEVLPLVLSQLVTIGVSSISYLKRPSVGLEVDRKSHQLYTYATCPDWTRAYERDFVNVDPAIRIGAITGKPSWWGDLLDARLLTATERAYLKAAADAGLKQGLTLPAFGPRGMNGFLMLSLNSPEGKNTICMQTMETVSYIVHRRYLEIEMHQSVTPSLSPRELDVVRWMVRGKSNSVIADILELSPSTVDTYARRIFLKLGASDRVTASLRAIAFGLLG